MNFLVSKTIINRQKKILTEPEIEPATSCFQVLYATAIATRACLYNYKHYSLIQGNNAYLDGNSLTSRDQKL